MKSEEGRKERKGETCREGKVKKRKKYERKR